MAIYMLIKTQLCLSGELSRVEGVKKIGVAMKEIHLSSQGKYWRNRLLNLAAGAYAANEKTID